MGAVACFVISLVRSSERRAAIAASLGALGLDFEFVDAIDAAQGFDADSETRLQSPRDGRLSDAEYACALSHVIALERFLAGDADHALILEDDALPSPALRRFVAGGHQGAAPLLLLYHSRARVYRHGAIPLFDGVQIRPLAIGCTAAVAYTLDRATARRLIEANTPVSRVADWPLDISQLGAHVLEPMIVGHPPRTHGQSILADQRGQRDNVASRFFTQDYLVRRWRKAVSTRIS